jgi:aminoglycoside/choline kinase family phosphotransferase
MAANKSIAQIGSTIEQLFKEHFGKPVESIALIPMSGSDRKYYRVQGAGTTAVGTYSNNVAENNTFLYITELFRKAKVPVPEVYVVSKDRRCYLQQDLGTTSLFVVMLREGHTDGVKKHFLSAVSQLVKIQWIAGRDVDYKQCYASKQFDEKVIMSDLLYFKYYFADLQNISYDRSVLMAEMEQMSKDLGRVQPHTLMYRDFQSRNIMVQDGQVHFIDYQGFMQGPPQYDLASMLWQARAQLPASWKEELLNQYFSALSEVTRVDEIYFRRGYVHFVLVRLLQVLGAYGFRGLLQHKPHFVSSIAPALQNLQVFLDANPQCPAYPEMRGLLEKMCTPEIQAKYAPAAASEKPKLVVQVCSFSYKNGIPKLGGQHGGGFVFDCRGLLNPGRYDAYKHLSGRDELVQQFLEQETKMPDFLSHSYALTSINVEDYIARGFEHLSICFGCTGGQHRSVYAAEKMAGYLQTRYNVTVTVSHLNEKNWVTSDNPKST